MALALAITKDMLDAMFGAQALTPPATYYAAALLTITDNTGAGGVEVSTASYARVAITNDVTEWPAATGTNEAKKVNANIVLFPTAMEDWGIVVAFALYDAASGGNFIMVGALEVSENIATGKTLQLNPGSIEITLGECA